MSTAEVASTVIAHGTVTLTATLDHLHEAMDFVTDELERQGCPTNTLNKVQIAIDELFANVCHYAYAGQDAPGQVTLSYTCTDEPHGIAIELCDQGVPFDPLAKEDPTAPTSIEDAKIGGLGIFMVKRCMDDVAYRRDGNTNVVTIRKSW